MQVLTEPRLETEQEDVHLIRTFLTSTKPNQAEFAVSRSNGHQKAKEYIGTDFVIIPEKIFDSMEKQPGHVKADTYEEEMAEIKKHSHGKIQKIYGPFYYDDSPEDYWYEAGVKLNGSKSASTLIENGSKTWTKFAVSPQVWAKGGQDDYNITDYKPMGLFLVIKGAYGDEAVIKKMCTGSELKCGTSLSAAILNLKNSDSDDYVSEVLSSYINISDTSKHNMSAQQIEKFDSPKTVTEVKLTEPTKEVKVEELQKQVQDTKQSVQEKLESPTGVTISQEEFEAYKKEREEHKQLVLENKTNKLNELFNVVEDADTKKSLVNKYINKDVNLIKEYHEDVFPHVEKFVKGKEVKVEDKSSSKSSSVLKEEPKKESNESLSASVVPNKVNEVLQFSKMFAGEVL